MLRDQGLEFNSGLRASTLGFGFQNFGLRHLRLHESKLLVSPFITPRCCSPLIPCAPRSHPHPPMVSPPRPTPRNASKVSTVTRMGPLGVAILVTVQSFLMPESCLPRKCRHFWTYVSSSRPKSVNSHRDQGGPHRYPRNCHCF